MKFYDLKNKSRFYQAYYGKGVKYEGLEKCPSYRCVSGKRNVPLYVVLHNNRMDGFMWTPSECMVTDRVRHILEDEGLTGFRFSPVVVTKVDHFSTLKEYRDIHEMAKIDKQKAISLLPPLWEFIITGYAGTAHPDSGMRLVKECNSCFHREYSNFGDKGLVVDEEKWDGSDFFRVYPMLKYIFITEKAKKIIEKYKIKRVEIVPVGEMRDSEGNFSSGPPSKYGYDDNF